MVIFFVIAYVHVTCGEEKKIVLSQFDFILTYKVKMELFWRRGKFETAVPCGYICDEWFV